MHIPQALLNKYNKPVPRYTSYPPANFFKDNLSEKEFIDSLQRSNNHKPENISIYIHIPFCNKICLYCGCNSMKLAAPDKVKRYIEAVKKELKAFRNYIDEKRKISQVHWGGGTPNSLPVEYINSIMDQLHSDYEFIPEPEIAIECNPARLTNEYIDNLDKSGFNRISLGIQDLNTEVLHAVNRDVPDRPVREIIDYIRTKNIKVNLDFIYGLPLQTRESFLKTISGAIELDPDRLVTFSYAHVPWVKSPQKVLEKFGLPDPEEKTQMFEKSAELLQSAGYRSIGFDHYAKPEDELYIALENRSLHRNFQGYCTRETTGQVYSAGISSISQLYDSYFQNTKNLNAYMELIENGKLAIEKGYKLDKKEIIIREVINELMCNFYLDFESIAGRFDIDADELKSITGIKNDVLNEFQDDDLLSVGENGIIKVKEYGKYFIRIIASAFDPLQSSDKKVIFSRSV